MATKEQTKECPFGIRMRFCKYQETYAGDLSSAIQGKLVFLCKHPNPEDCPEFENLRRD